MSRAEWKTARMLFGDGVAIDAFELRDGSPAGYQFQKSTKVNQPLRPRVRYVTIQPLSLDDGVKRNNTTGTNQQNTTRTQRMGTPGLRARST